MAFLTTWYTTDLPKEVIEILEEDIKKFDPIAQESKLHGDAVDKVLNPLKYYRDTPPTPWRIRADQESQSSQSHL